MLSLSVLMSAKSQVERYRSLDEGTITTISLPRFSGRFASWSAAHTAAPEEMPIGMPSSWFTCFETGPESVSFTRITSS